MCFANRSLALLLAVSLAAYNMGCAPGKPTGEVFNAARDGNMGEIKSHVHWKSDLNKKGPSDFRAIHYAVVFGHLEIAEALLKAGAEVAPRDNRGYTPLHMAAWAGRLDMVKLLVEHKADINALDVDKMSPYQLATIGKQKETADYLKSKGADTKLRPVVNHPRSATPGG